MHNENRVLSLKNIFVFWYPLAATWLMMACENPFLAAVIARLDDPKYNLAAFGVAFSFALIVEAPIIMLMTASTALAKDRDSYCKLRRFTWILNSGITAVMLITLLPPVFYWLAADLMELPPRIVRLTHIALLLLLPWPAAIGFRRFYQGLLIRNNLTRRVAYGTVVRLSSMALSASMLYFLKIKGAFVGAAALSTGVVLEAIASRVMAHQTIKSLLKGSATPAHEGTGNKPTPSASQPPLRRRGLLCSILRGLPVFPSRDLHGGTPKEREDIRKKRPAPESTAGTNSNRPLTYRFIIKFYYPLAMMSILSLGIHPIVTFFMGRSRFPVESLAVLPVVNALVFIFRSMGLSYQEVGIALMGERNEKHVPIRNFALLLCAAVTAGIALVVFTPLAEIWFVQVSGLSLELSGFSYLPAQILVLLPASTIWISYQRSLLVNLQKTAPISRATLIEVILIALWLFAAIKYLDMIGAVAAASAYTIGRVGANLYLLRHQRRAEKN